ncbi:MAG: transposase [Desulfobulbaceae bacterium]|nr:transposase [Desulfobulbaceae bacterium]
MKTSFARAFGREVAGALLHAASHINTLKNILNPIIIGLDPRSSNKKYSIDEIIWTVVLMLFLREESRNNMNTLRKSEIVLIAFMKLFGIRLPHLDTCDVVLKKIVPEDLKAILSVITSYLIKQKLFESARNFGRVSVTFDGTGIGTIEVDESDFKNKPGRQEGEPTDYLPSELFQSSEPTKSTTTGKNGRIDVTVDQWATGKMSKNGVRHFTRQLILLRITGPNGLSIIIDWEPINTKDGSRKEDCEQAAAKRLLARFKVNFKRLQVTIIADGLYANQTFIKLAEDLGFKYIYTLKDESLKNIWKEINAIKGEIARDFPERLIKIDIGILAKQILIPNAASGTNDIIYRDYEWINDLSHAGSTLSWCSLNERTDDDEKFYFSVITNLSPNTVDVQTIMRLARERNIIEDGFNTLKNRGFAMKHKFSRTSDFASMNYITLMSVADILSNIVFASDWLQRTYFSVNEKYSIRSLICDMKTKMQSFVSTQIWDRLRSYLPEKTSYSRPVLT